MEGDRQKEEIREGETERWEERKRDRRRNSE